MVTSTKQRKRTRKRPSNMTITELLEKKRVLMAELEEIKVELNKASQGASDISSEIRPILDMARPTLDIPPQGTTMDYSVRVMDPLEEGDTIESLRASIDQLTQI
jgi:hypothetical protein